MSKKAVFVTLADKNYLEYAKQVFAGAYFNAGWKGDYLLLAHDCSEKDVAWFKKKGILVYHCKPIFKEKIANTHPSIVSKFYLFTEYFKRWDHVVYYDADVIIRASLDELLNVKGFASVACCFNEPLKHNLIDESELGARKVKINEYSFLKKQLSGKYNLKTKAFGAGMFVFSTEEVIKANTFERMKQFAFKYRHVLRSADQSTLNFFFYDRWLNLPYVYDFYLDGRRNQWLLRPGKIEAITLHLMGFEKPWDKASFFYQEWQANLSKANMLKVGAHSGGKIWSTERIEEYEEYLLYRESIFRLTQRYFKVVFFVERKFPKLFKYLKSTKLAILNYFGNKGKFWDKLPEEYVGGFLRPGGLLGRGQDYQNPGRILIRRIIQKELRNHNNSIGVLDVGCATGLDYEYFKNANLDVDYTGLDSTAKFIDYAKIRYPQAKWIKGDIENLPFPDQSHDLVMCRHVLEHLSDFRRALSEMMRISRDLVIVDFFIAPSGAEKKVIERIGLPGLSNKTAFVNHNVYSKADIINLAKANGWRIKELKENMTKNGQNFDTVYVFSRQCQKKQSSLR